MNCSSCAHENPAGARFCNNCGEALRSAGSAPVAESPVPARAPHTYTPKHLAEKILRSRSALEGERKQTTVLFADVKGSLELAEQFDPAEWRCAKRSRLF